MRTVLADAFDPRWQSMTEMRTNTPPTPSQPTTTSSTKDQIGETMTDLGTRPDSRRRISLNGSGTRPKDTGEADEHHESRAERRRRRGAETRRETKPISLWVFFSITFGMSWGLRALAVVFQEQIEALTGPIGLTNPLFMLVVYSPAIAGIGLVWRHYGREGLRRYFRRLLMWRMPRSWWVYLVLSCRPSSTWVP